MELKQIKELMRAMGLTGISKLVLKKEGEFELQLERGTEGAIERLPLRDLEEFQNPLPVIRPSEPLFVPSQIHTPAGTPVQPVEEGKFINSPMVGTFYASPSPEDPPFVKVGDKVEAQTVVCIIEAMKVMNEVKAGAPGTITEILMTGGHPVEFGTKLFRIA